MRRLRRPNRDRGFHFGPHPAGGGEPRPGQELLGGPAALGSLFEARAGIAVALILLLLVVVVGPPEKTSAPVLEVLSTDQTLSFPIARDVSDLDPAQMSNPTDIDIFRNVFSGLYRFDQSLHEVPDLAPGPADLSPAGPIYTFHIRHDAVFSHC